jgi:hypothetical protein
MSKRLKPEEIVYHDGVIAVALMHSPTGGSMPSMALRWLPPQPYIKDGKKVPATNSMGGETDWFIIPYSLAVGMARVLVEQKAVGLAHFKDDGFSKMVSWLADLGGLEGAMCY